MLATRPVSGGLLVEAPAKVNLTLRVLGARGDGYHNLESVVAAVTLSDSLEFHPAGSIHLTCNGADVPAGEDNLVMKAARRLAGECRYGGGALIHLTKRIPPGRGFGGGSSDAAATLLGLNALWRTGLDRSDLACLGAAIGSDVPLFLGPPISVIRGRGEHVEPIDAAPPWRLVLAWPGFGLTTSEVYAAYDRLGSGGSSGPRATEIIVWLNGPVREVRPFLVNDLEPAADIVRGARVSVRSILERSGAPAVGMTGSGSAYFALADTEADARRMADKARAAGIESCVAGVVGDAESQREAPS